MRRTIIAVSLALGISLTACGVTTPSTSASSSTMAQAAAVSPPAPGAGLAQTAPPVHTPLGQGAQVAQGQGPGQGNGRGPGQGRGNGTAVTQPVSTPPSNLPETPCLICETELSQYAGPLNADEIEALQLALNDEYHAWAVYNQVIADHGAVRPFTNILASEATHISRLEALFTTYGLSIPATNPWVGQAPTFPTVSEACSAGAAAEVANVALYDRLLASTSRTDILTVYRALQAASEQNHLPAFQRCGGA